MRGVYGGLAVDVASLFPFWADCWVRRTPCRIEMHTSHLCMCVYSRPRMLLLLNKYQAPLENQGRVRKGFQVESERILVVSGYIGKGRGG